MDISDELERLHDLKEKGAISEEEFQQAKESVLRKNRSAGQHFDNAVRGISSDTKMWSMLIHLTQFCGHIVPLAGLVVPIVLWQIKKYESAEIDAHGRIVTNWIITEIILGVIFALLCLVGIGIPLLIGLGIMSVVYPIIGGIKANNGEVWSYPFSLNFF